MESLFNLEHFSLYLAANFTPGGHEQLQEKLKASLSRLPSPSATLEEENKTAPDSTASVVCVPMYWRSSLLVEVGPFFLPSCVRPSRTTCKDCMADNNEYNDANDSSLASSSQTLEVLFLDATISFVAQFPWQQDPATLRPCGIGSIGGITSEDSNSHKPSYDVPVVFGALLRQKCPSFDTKTAAADKYFYINGPPVTTMFLREHMDQNDTVLDETNAHVIAKHMARAMKQAPKGLRSTGKFHTAACKVDDSGANDSLKRQCLYQVDIPLRYEDGEETSLLTISSVTNSKRNAVDSRNGNEENDSFRMITAMDPTIAETWMFSMLSNSHDDSAVSNYELDAESSKDMLSSFEIWKQQTAEHFVATQRAAFEETQKMKQQKDGWSVQQVNRTESATTLANRETCHKMSPVQSKKGKKKSKPRPAILGPQGAARVGGRANKKFKVGAGK